VLPVLTLGSSLRQQHPTMMPTFQITTATTAITTTPSQQTTATPSDTTTTAAETPSGESASSRVLPPVNVSVSVTMSKDQLRRRTEQVYWPAVHKDAVPPHIEESMAPTNTTGHKDTTRAYAVTSSEGVTRISDNEVGSCGNVAENTVSSQVSSNVCDDSVDSVIVTD